MPDTSVNLSAAELGAWRGMLRVHTALVKALDAELAAAHDLPLSSYEVLITLETAPGRKRRMAELADSVLLSRSGMTRLVDRLEKDESARCATRAPTTGAAATRCSPRRARSCWRPRGRRTSTACASASCGTSPRTRCGCWRTLWERVLPGSAGLDE